MSDILVLSEALLEKSKELIGDSEADITAVQDTLKALREVSPDLIDSKIYERLSRLVDSARIAEDTQTRVSQLNLVIIDQQKHLDKLTDQTKTLQTSFDRLYGQLVRGDMADQQTRQKLNYVLSELEQYLRRHS